MINNTLKKLFKSSPRISNFILLGITFILMLLIKMYLVQFCYNKIAPKILKDENAYKLTFTDAFFLVIILMS